MTDRDSTAPDSRRPAAAGSSVPPTLASGKAASPTVRRVLVAVPLDETADWAVLEGLRLARASADVELHLVHVVEGSELNDPDEALRDTERRLAAAPGVVERRIERLWNDDQAPARLLAHFPVGDPAETILQLSVDIDADLIIVGTHRRAGLEKMLFGSVSTEVLRRVHCPVLVAIPKDYSGSRRSRKVEGPCADCSERRRATAGAEYWCERHSKTYHAPHVYTPRHVGRNSVMVTY